MMLPPRMPPLRRYAETIALPLVDGFSMPFCFFAFADYFFAAAAAAADFLDAARFATRLSPPPLMRLSAFATPLFRHAGAFAILLRYADYYSIFSLSFTPLPPAPSFSAFICFDTPLFRHALSLSLMLPPCYFRCR
jgi:hypothetical protein